MPLGSRLYMLAGDHRWQWEEWCVKAGVPSARIGEVKGLIFDAFMEARRRAPSVKEFGALLLDLVYAAPYVSRAVREGIEIATPAERAGVFPLQWGFDPFGAGLTGSLAKVLIRHRPEQPAAEQDAQLAKLVELQGWCRAHGKPLIVEVVVMRAGEPEEEFDATGRPMIVAAAIRRAYARGLAPEVWKLEGTHTMAGARLIDEAIRERPGCAQIILGKGADRESIDRWFDTAAACPSAIGFAIGRSVFWDPATRYLMGTLTADAATAAMVASYLSLVKSWERRLR
jgi:myo-inositol catabolism protein IolC